MYLFKVNIEKPHLEAQFLVMQIPYVYYGLYTTDFPKPEGTQEASRLELRMHHARCDPATTVP